MKLVVLFAFLAVCWAQDPAADETLGELSGAANPDPELFKIFTEVFEGQKNCMATGLMPEKPRSLSFCHKFNDQACCVPTLDMENNEMFDAMTDLGLSCRLRGDVRDHPMAKFYCLNCDPQQPQYVRNAPYTALLDGSPSDGRDLTLLVCKDWAEGAFGTNPLLDVFNRCGIMKSSPCQGDDGPLDDRDRFTCGDDLVIPSVTFRNNDSGDEMTPAQSIEAFLNADSVGPPLIDEAVGFLLVENRPCTAAEATTFKGDTTLQDEARCLLTAAQQADILNRPTTGTLRVAACDNDLNFLRANPEACSSLRDEICFNSAAGVTASALVLMFACAFALLF